MQRLAAALRDDLGGFRSVRDRHTLVVKRLGDAAATDRGPEPRDDTAAAAALRETLRPVLRDTDPFPARVDGLDVLAAPSGDAVVSLSVDSPGLVRLHRRLAAEFGAVDRVEGDAYLPHVTLARGWSGPGNENGDGSRNGDGSENGSADASLRAVTARLRGRIESAVPVEWTVDELGLWSREYREFVWREPLG
ncbi:2'-5' RNA ligase family protein [Halobaculum sp. D14]|uniref:2'-5' RNA ligase family protein n=1 Tax=Halobaculum sp. D14 TaxID=3421642 RepID=UPI003EBFC376